MATVEEGNDILEWSASPRCLELRGVGFVMKPRSKQHKVPRIFLRKLQACQWMATHFTSLSSSCSVL